MEDSFYSFPLHAIRLAGLRPELSEGRLRLLDKQGIKWEIRTITNLRLSLYHRNKQGTGMYYQKRSAPTTFGGVESLLHSIRQHEEYERRKRHYGL